MLRLIRRTLPTIIAAWFIFIPRFASACAVCFGGASKDLSRGFFWGVIVLIFLPFTLAAFIFSAIARASKRKQP